MRFFTYTFRLSSLYILGLFLYAANIQAQQTPIMNTYIFQPEYYNPAAIGGGQVAVLHRRQWVNFDSDIAPTTYAVVADFSTLLPDNLSRRIGLGLNLMSDQAHIFNRTNVDLSFAYHLFREGPHRFTMGLMAGFMRQNLNYGDISVSSIDDIELFSGSSNKMVFDGGPGLSYNYRGEKNELAIDITVPQLFTSDLNYGEELQGQAFDNRFHILAGIRYRVNLEGFSLEPAVLYRSVNGLESTVDKNTFDLNLRAFLLGDLLWLSGGTRLNADTYLGGIGFNINENINLQGIFEYHTTLGPTFEFGIAYRFKRKPRLDPLLVGLTNDLNLERESIQNAGTNLQPNEISKVRDRITFVERTFNQVTNPNITNNEINEKVQQAEGGMSQARKDLNELLNYGQTVFNSVWIAGRKIQVAKNKGTQGSETDQLYETIEQEGNTLNRPLNQVNNQYNRLNNQISSFKEQKGIEATIASMIKNRDASALEVRLKSDLSKVPGIEENTKVEVKQSDQLSIVYTFPFIENTYKLGEGMDSRTLTVDHINDQIKQIQKEGNQISKVDLKMLLQDAIQDMQTTNSFYPYLGEFGELLSVPLSLYDTDEERRSSSTIKLDKWKATSITDLVGLRLEGVKRYLQTKGLRTSIPVNLEISGPNYDEEDSQTLVIELFIQ